MAGLSDGALMLSVLVVHRWGTIEPLMPGRLGAVVTLDGMVRDGRCDARATVVEPPSAPRETRPAETNLRALALLAQRLGGRVEGKMDTSDRWAHVLVRVACNEWQRALDLNLMSSGYEGDDAPPLRTFCALLFDLVGLREESAWLDMTGGSSRNVWKKGP